jgi:Fe-S-cluster-containing dehydrogenase component
MGTDKINSRRKFLAQAALVTGGLFVSGGLHPFKAMIYATEKKKGNGPWFGMGIDLEKCIGCGRCADACKSENHVPRDPFFFRTWVEQYTILNDQSVHITSPNGGIDGFRQEFPDEDIFKSFFVPKMCNHCVNSPCTQVCPVGATFESPEGISLVDPTYCIGCRYCVQACPYGCRYIHPEKKVVDKCTMCYHRIMKGMKPACVEVCPTGAKIFGDLNDPKSDLVLFLKEHSWQVLKPHMNTEPKVYYNGLRAEVR